MRPTQTLQENVLMLTFRSHAEQVRVLRSSVASEGRSG